MADKNASDDFACIFEIKILVSLYALWAFFFAVFGTAINDANLLEGQPPKFGFLMIFNGTHSATFYNLLFFPIVSTSLLFGLLFGLRAILPNRLKPYLRWKVPDGYEVVQNPERSWPAVLTALIGLSATAVLYFAATHLRSDRSHRQPIVFWEGPAADYFEWLLVLGWTLSYLAVCGAVFVSNHFESRWNPLAILGIFFGSMNFILSCFIGAILNTD